MLWFIYFQLFLVCETFSIASIMSFPIRNIFCFISNGFCLIEIWLFFSGVFPDVEMSTSYLFLEYMSFRSMASSWRRLSCLNMHEHGISIGGWNDVLLNLGTLFKIWVFHYEIIYWILRIICAHGSYFIYVLWMRV